MIDIDDSVELQRIADENPFTPFSEDEIGPAVEPGAALAIISEVASVQAQASG